MKNSRRTPQFFYALVIFALTLSQSVAQDAKTEPLGNAAKASFTVKRTSTAVNSSGITQAIANEPKGPTLITTTDEMRYVPSLASRRSELIPYQYVEEEAQDGRSKRNIPITGKGSTGDDALANDPHPLSQSRAGKAPSLVFDAYSSGSQPTDPSGAVGPNHYFAVFNTGFIIYDKAGNDLTGQLAVTNIFSSPNCCDLTVSYDSAADRWVLSYLLGAGAGAEVAVSDGPNPVTAGWFVYTVSAVNDYQKLSVWSDGYYMTDNTSATNRVYALERAAMLAGSGSAGLQSFPLPGIVTSGFYSPQAFNVTNNNYPAAGSMPIVYLQDDAWGGVTTDHIKMWEIDVDWVTPANSMISAATQFNTTAFTSVFDGGSFVNLTQPGGTDIDALQATIMNQAQFRRFGTHNSAVFNFVVDTDGGSGELAGVRWFEFRQNGDGLPWSLYQEGTYTAPDGKHAWNASIMMDGNGNIGMGYTGMSGPTTPSTVRVSSYYTGRLECDPLGTMTIAEQTIANGNQNIPGTRYGDYSKIDIDPSDDETFWFINEYMNSGRRGVTGVFTVTATSAEVSFQSTTGNTVEDTNCSFTDINVPVIIACPGASANADVNFTVNGGGTATAGLDFDLMTPSVTFLAGTTTPQNMVLRVYHDGFVEGAETVIIDFTVNANGGDATANTSADQLTFTINDDDAAPTASSSIEFFNEDFETIPAWTVIDQDGDGFNWTIGTVPGPHLSTQHLHSRSWIGPANPLTPDNYVITQQIALPANLTSLNLTYQVAPGTLTNPWFEEFYTVYWAADVSSAATINASPQVLPGAIIAQAIVNENIDMSAYIGQTGYLVFRHWNCTDEEYIAIDNMVLSGNIQTNIQTAVNSGAPDQIDLPGSGTVHTSDPTSGDVMADITNGNSFDYGCLDVSVSRSGTGAQSYNGSTAPDLVMDKTFDIRPTNTTGTGSTSVTFYFEEAEVAGWESATGLSRNQLVAGRGTPSVITETSALAIGAFGTDVTLTGNFTGLDGTYYFGTTDAFVACIGAVKTWNGASWSPPGAPGATNPVVINGNYDTSVNGDITACSLTVNTGFTLTVGASSFAQVENGIVVDGSLIIEHTGNLVQVENDAAVTNNGTINVNVTTPVLQTRDFMVLGTPMSAETRTGVYNSAFLVLEHTPVTFIPHPLVPAGGTNFADDNNDFWTGFASGPLNVGEGYIVRPQTGYTDPANIAYNYTHSLGTLNNGTVNRTVIYNGAGPNPDGTPNVFSNPYASAISADDFINNNSLVNEVYFWEHLTPPSSSIPGANSINFSMDDISMYNLSGGVAAANDPGNSTEPNGIISTSQGFGIKATAAGTIGFTNSMRRTTGNNTLRNLDTDINRIWLKVTNADYDIKSNTMVAFNPIATAGLDAGYDTDRIATVISLYSHLEDGSEQLGIQTREMFADGLKVPLGFATQVDADLEYTISISDVDGVAIGDATVYLIDTELNVITDLTAEDYTFRSEPGTFSGRFVLQFEYEVLGIGDELLEAITMYPNPTKGVLSIVSSQKGIQNVEVRDVAGRIVQKLQSAGENQVNLDLSGKAPSVYFVTIHTDSGSITKRVIKE